MWSLKLFQSQQSSAVRRKFKRLTDCGGSVEQFESRVVLSHGGLSTKAAAVDYTGNWLMTTESGQGTMVVDQNTESIHVVFNFPSPQGAINLAFRNKVPHGEVLKLKAKGEVAGAKASARVKAHLTGENDLTGSVKVKSPGQEIQEVVDFTANRSA